MHLVNYCIIPNTRTVPLTDSSNFLPIDILRSCNLHLTFLSNVLLHDLQIPSNKNSVNSLSCKIW